MSPNTTPSDANPSAAILLECLAPRSRINAPEESSRRQYGLGGPSSPDRKSRLPYPCDQPSDAGLLGDLQDIVRGFHKSRIASLATSEHWISALAHLHRLGHERGSPSTTAGFARMVERAAASAAAAARSLAPLSTRRWRRTCSRILAGSSTGACHRRICWCEIGSDCPVHVRSGHSIHDWAPFVAGLFSLGSAAHRGGFCRG
jgi:hypothetical protein